MAQEMGTREKERRTGVKQGRVEAGRSRAALAEAEEAAHPLCCLTRLQRRRLQLQPYVICCAGS